MIFDFKRTTLIVFSLLIVAVAVVPGCIPVEDFGAFWEQGQLDPQLAGNWKQLGVQFRIDDQYLVFEKDEAAGVYLDKSTGPRDLASANDEPGIHIRTTHLGGYPFMMIRVTEAFMKRPGAHIDTPDVEQPAPTGGGIQRYSIEGDVLTMYYLDDSVLWEDLKSGRVEGKLPKDDEDSTDYTLPALSTLDDKTVAYIKQLCADDTKWSRIVKYERITDLDAALKLSRTYPATPDTPKNATVAIDQPGLAYFADGRADILQRHLQASPEWKVSPERDALIAYRREHVINSTWQVSLNGYKSRYAGRSHVQTRHLFRFAQEGGGPFANEYNRSMLTIAPPESGDVLLNLRSSSQGIESYLAVGKPGLWFEFFEQTDQESRTYTRSALEELAEMMKVLRESEDEVRQKGFASRLMPKDGVIHGEPSMQIKDSFQGGLYDVVARVNPGRPGTVYLKAFRTDTHEPLREKHLGPESQEYMGWSANPDDLFLFNAHITISEGDWGTLYPARFELWLKPTGDDPEIKLIETQAEIVGRQR